jgi:uncharacterized protein (DUF1778 family)
MSRAKKKPVHVPVANPPLVLSAAAAAQLTAILNNPTPPTPAMKALMALPPLPVRKPGKTR